MGMTDPADLPVEASLARNVVAVGVRLHRILAHMERTIAAGGSSPGAPPPPVVLESLLDGCLAELVDRDPMLTELMAIALGEIAEIVEEEILLVDTRAAPRPPNRTERRRRRC